MSEKFDCSCTKSEADKQMLDYLDWRTRKAAYHSNPQIVLGTVDGLQNVCRKYSDGLFIVWEHGNLVKRECLKFIL